MAEKSIKNCTESGQWTVKDGFEWTDYTPCLNKQVSVDMSPIHSVSLYYMFLVCFII